MLASAGCNFPAQQLITHKFLTLSPQKTDAMCSMRLAVEHQLMSQRGLNFTMAWLQVRPSSRAVRVTVSHDPIREVHLTQHWLE